MLWVEGFWGRELRLWKPTGHRFAIPDLSGYPLYPSVAGFSSKWAHQVTFAHQSVLLNPALTHLLQLIKEKKPNCFLWKALGEIISHLQDRDNEEEIRTLYGPAVRDWAAGWIGVTPCLCFPGGGRFSAMCTFWNSACLPFFFSLAVYLSLLSIQVDSSASLHRISVWRNARPEEIHLRSFQALSCSSLPSPWKSPQWVPFPQCPGLSGSDPQDYDSCGCSFFLFLSLGPHQTNYHSRPYSGFRKIRSCPVWMPGTPLWLSVQNGTIFAAPWFSTLPATSRSPALSLRFHSAAFPTDWPSLLVLRAQW